MRVALSVRQRLQSRIPVPGTGLPASVNGVSPLVKVIPTLVVATLLSTACAGERVEPPPSAPSPFPTDPFAPPVLRSNAGPLVSAPFPDRTTVFDFWMLTCDACRRSLQGLVAKRREMESAGATLVLVAALDEDENIQDGADALARWGMPGEPFFVADADTLPRRLGYPTTIIVDRIGVVRWVAPEGASADDVLAATESVARSFPAR
jgi:hypothetical protein